MKQVLLYLILIVFVPNLIFAAFSLSEDEVVSAITSTEENVSLAYQAIRDAEGAGANVSNLLSQLNRAGELLAQAKMSYRTGDFNEAMYFADTSTEIANQVKIESYKTRDLALYASFQHFQLALTESILGIGMVIFGSFMGWNLFKRRYYRQLLKLKPEMSSDEP